jgi:threonine synthase
VTGPRAPSVEVGPAGGPQSRGGPATASTPPLPIGLVCAGCGYRVPDDRVFAARCPVARDGDDIDHVLRRVVDTRAIEFPRDEDPATFVRYRALSRGYHAARAAGWADADVARLIRDLDDAIAVVDGTGFRETPFEPVEELATRLGSTGGGVWVKDETRNVSGSHKARYLMGAMLELLIDEALTGRDRPGPLAIASCGNAALAAAVVARAAGRRLEVFVPTWADEAVVARLTGLGANLVTCPRAPGEAGDPTYRALRAAIADGAVPFTCQGTENGLAIAGGETLGYEMVARLARPSGSDRHGTVRPELDAVVVQVGGGALASSVAAAFAEALAFGVVRREPRLYAVQAEGCAPLARAWARLRERAATVGMPAALEDARLHRSAYMWPWETEPTSVAHGILDDETYDWLVIVEALARTGGDVVVVDEATIAEANWVGRASTGIDADPTGTAGLAGLLSLRRSGDVRPDETAAVLFTGAAREGGRGEAPIGSTVANPQSMERSRR